MDTKIFWGLLTLYQIIIQGSESLSLKNINKTSNLHFRKRRIIDISDHRDESVLNQEVRYVVLIRDASESPMCTGIILQSSIILTAAHCVIDEPFSIVSGRNSAGHMKSHRIIGYTVHEEYVRSIKIHDIALILLGEPIDIVHSYHRAIRIYNGEIPPNSHGLVTGWGCTSRTDHVDPPHALSIYVPIIPLEECQNLYHRNRKLVTNLNICTLYQNRTKSCWFGDSGGPLTFNGRLVGVFSWFSANSNPRLPDVFINLLIHEHKSWILTRLYNIHSYIH